MNSPTVFTDPTTFTRLLSHPLRFETLPLVIRLLLIALTCLGLPACTILPKVTDKPVTHALAAPQTGPLAEAGQRIERRLPAGQSAFLLLEDAKEGLDWRLALIDSAQSSIDIQLYLWHGGASSMLIFDRALQAADRGVRVRILVDDFLFSGNETAIATLCQQHPHFDIRLFNPGRVRNSTLGGLAEWASNFRALNRRMHNKTFTVDRTLSIVGGRNIGDHYFGMDRKYNFIDLDVLAGGPVVEEVSDGFDEFWNSSLSFPGSHLSRRVGRRPYESLVEKYRVALREERSDRLRDYPLKTQDWSSTLARLPRGMHFGRADFIQDHPEVEDDNRQLVQAVESLARRRKGEAIVVSPYFLPADASVENLKNTTSAGVEVKILTASLEANNQPLVDGHYRKLRPPLVDNGASLYEFRPDPSPAIRSNADISVHSKRVTLHAKTIVLDRRYSFIGSLNLDPRALDINTESGMFVDSPSLARELAEWIDDLCAPDSSWEITRNPDGKIQWDSSAGTRTSEPPAKWSRRMMSRISGIRPIRDQL